MEREANGNEAHELIADAIGGCADSPPRQLQELEIREDLRAAIVHSSHYFVHT